MTNRRQIVLLLAAAPAALLGGCAGGTGIDPNLLAFLNQVAAGVKAACGVLPVLADIEQLIPIYGRDAVAIETAICAAVSMARANGAKAAPSQVIVHGVIIHFQ